MAARKFLTLNRNEARAGGGSARFGNNDPRPRQSRTGADLLPVN
jgi:hypothetical protein